MALTYVDIPYNGEEVIFLNSETNRSGTDQWIVRTIKTPTWVQKGTSVKIIIQGQLHFIIGVVDSVSYSVSSEGNNPDIGQNIRVNFAPNEVIVLDDGSRGIGFNNSGATAKVYAVIFDLIYDGDQWMLTLGSNIGYTAG